MNDSLKRRYSGMTSQVNHQEYSSHLRDLKARPMLPSVSLVLFRQFSGFLDTGAEKMLRSSSWVKFLRVGSPSRQSLALKLDFR